MTWQASRVFKVATLLLLTALLCNTVMAANRPQRRRGKVIIIRGAFTVSRLV